ncbi:MAG: DUF2878 domain-containing protein [Acidobacteriota bacterium]|nr:MAG: DUF2878 domain-containing protein [Acidobacteriota bacterium]
MIARVLSFLLMYLGWFACVLGAAHDRAGLGALVTAVIVVINIRLAPSPARALVLVLFASTIGPLVDLIPMRLELLVLHEGGHGLWPPAWWIMLWAVFSSTLHASFGWLKDRYALAALLGATFGPASYLAGARLGAADLHPDLWPSLLAFALEWLVMMPFLLWLARIVPPRAEPVQMAPSIENH